MAMTSRHGWPPSSWHSPRPRRVRPAHADMTPPSPAPAASRRLCPPRPLAACPSRHRFSRAGSLAPPSRASRAAGRRPRRQPAGAAHAPTALVRTGDHPGYGRVVFDLPPGASWTLDRAGDRLTVRFSGADPLAGAKPPRNVRALTVAAGAAELSLAPGVQVRPGRLGNRLLLDVLDPVGAAAAARPPRRLPRLTHGTAPRQSRPRPPADRGTRLPCRTARRRRARPRWRRPRRPTARPPRPPPMSPPAGNVPPTAAPAKPRGNQRDRPLPHPAVGSVAGASVPPEPSRRRQPPAAVWS